MAPAVVGDGLVPDIAHEIFQHYPNKARPKQSLETIQKALLVADGQVLLDAVKAFAKEMEHTKTTNPMWAEDWFIQNMWKSYLPVANEPEQTQTTQAENDQNFSRFSKEFYESN